MDLVLDRQRTHGLDEVDGALAEAVEVSGEKRVGAAQLARPTHRAVDVVAGHVLDA